MKKFFGKIFSKKDVNLSKYTNNLNSMKNVDLNEKQLKILNKNEINIRSKINQLNSTYATKGKYSDNLSGEQINDIIKKINEQKLNKLRNNTKNENINIEITDIDNKLIAKEFENTKWKNKKTKLKKSREWRIVRTISIIGIGIGIWRGTILLAQEKNKENMQKVIEKQVQQNNNELKKNKSDGKKIKELKYENEQLNKLNEQAEIIGEGMSYLSDEELKFYLSLSAENRIRYLVEIGYLSVNVDGSLKLNSTSNMIIYLIIGFVIIIIVLIIYFLFLK
jgi:hypothetical protein